MGYVAHHAIIVTTEHWPAAHRARAKAVEILGDQISPFVFSPVNGYVSFFIAPDGSKEGWAESDAGDRERAEFLTWARTAERGYLDCVEVRYGGDVGQWRGIEEQDAVVPPAPDGRAE